MATLKCLENIDPTKQERASELRKISDKWFDNKVIDALTGGNSKDFKRFYNQILGLDFDTSRLPTTKELKTLDKSTNKFLSDIKKTPSKFGQLFYLPEVLAEKHPVTKKYFKDLVLASNFYRGNQHNISSDLKLIGEYLNTNSGIRGMMSKGGYGKDIAQKEINKRETTYNKLKQEGKLEKADDYYNEYLRDLYTDGELSSLQSLHELMLDPTLVNKQKVKATKLKYSTQLVLAANTWHLPVKNKKGKIIQESLKDRLWKILGDGLKDNIDMLKKVETDYNREGFRIKKLEQLYDDYFAPNAPKKVKNYFPRQVLDIAPTFSKLNRDIYAGKIDTQQKTITQYIDRMIEDVTANLQQPGHIYERAYDAPSRLSKDVLGVLDHYAKNSIRFNYNARVSKVTTEALQKLLKLEGKDSDNHLTFLKDFIESTHQGVLGTNYQNSKLANLSRTITSYQFISKLGLNVRSAARNSTQSLQNWVYFGHTGIRQAMRDLQSDRLKRIVNEEMGVHGFEFVNIQEFAMPKDLLMNLKLDSSGKVMESAPKTVDKVNSWFENIAKITGKPMQWVENHVNRGLTFKIGFLQEYKRLSQMQDIVERAVLKNPDRYKKLHKKRGITWDELSTNERVEQEIRRRSSSKGAEYVKDLHYLYDPFAKPKILRSPVGSVLGQFSTYSINFFNYQRKIALKGGKAALAREWNDPAVARLVRLGLLYTFVTGLSAITNTKWGNLIENDTWERLKQLDQYYTGTEEEKEKAFFGKRPATAIFGGPFISDVLKIGSLINFDTMNDDEFVDYIGQYQDFSDRMDKPDKVEELVRMLNTGVGRFTYTTLPNMINGASFPTVIGQELGLYQTNDYRGLKDKILSFKNYLPEKQKQYFTPKERTKKEVEYSREEVELMLEAFRKAQGV